MTFSMSPQQADVDTWTRQGKGSAILEAVAGSGKTTTIINVVIPGIPEKAPVVVLMFNAHIAREANEKLDLLRKNTGRAFSNVYIKTFHGLGYGAVLKRLNASYSQVKPDSKKVLRLTEKLWGNVQVDMYGSFCAKLVGMAKGQGVGILCEDTPHVWRQMIEHHDLTLDHDEADYDTAIRLSQALLAESNRVAKEERWIDYDDQLYLPLLWRCTLFPQRWVIIDEAQDTNPVRRAIARLALAPGGRLLAVGDRHQAIYGFTGASHDALDLIASDFSATRLPLTVSYRCPKVAEPLAQKTVKEFTVHPSAVEGKVVSLSVKDAMPLLDGTSAVLCRNCAPLVRLAYVFLKKGKACHVLGSEIGKGLIGLVKKMKARDIDDTEEGRGDGLVSKLEAYRAREVASFMAKGEEQRAAGVEDRVECVNVFIDGLAENERTIGHLIGKIDALFADGTHKVLTLSTIHKAKGQEWPTVAVLRQDLSPSPYARQEWQMGQEENLVYVRNTRFQDTLIFLTDEGRE